MLVCEICENEAKEVFKCKGCGARFCAKCGDRARELCEDCLDYADIQQSGSEDLDSF